MQKDSPKLFASILISILLSYIICGCQSRTLPSGIVDRSKIAESFTGETTVEEAIELLGEPTSKKNDKERNGIALIYASKTDFEDSLLLVFKNNKYIGGSESLNGRGRQLKPQSK